MNGFIHELLPFNCIVEHIFNGYRKQTHYRVTNVVFSKDHGPAFVTTENNFCLFIRQNTVLVDIGANTYVDAKILFSNKFGIDSVCTICLEKKHNSIVCSDCNHSICDECIAIAFDIDKERVVQRKCFASMSCSGKYSMNALKHALAFNTQLTLLFRETAIKRYISIAGCPEYSVRVIPCPQCTSLCVHRGRMFSCPYSDYKRFKLGTFQFFANILECDDCGTRFCAECKTSPSTEEEVTNAPEFGGIVHNCCQLDQDTLLVNHMFALATMLVCPSCGYVQGVRGDECTHTKCITPGCDTHYCGCCLGELHTDFETFIHRKLTYQTSDMNRPAFEQIQAWTDNYDIDDWHMCDHNNVLHTNVVGDDLGDGPCPLYMRFLADIDDKYLDETKISEWSQQNGGANFFEFHPTGTNRQEWASTDDMCMKVRNNTWHMRAREQLLKFLRPKRLDAALAKCGKVYLNFV